MKLSKKHILLPAVSILIASQSMFAQNMDETTTTPVAPQTTPVLLNETGANETVIIGGGVEESELSQLNPEPVSPTPALAAQPTPPRDNATDTLSVDFPDEDVRNVLRNVADLFELNIIVPDALTGRTSIKLRDVTWRQLYKVVLEPYGYTFVEEGNIIKIISRDALQLEPFTTESLALENVPATSVESVLRPMLSLARPATAAELAKAGGTLVVNSLANELIITDQPAVILRMIATAKLMDIEPKQVVIETKFVEINKATTDALGVSLAGKDLAGGGSSLSNVSGNTFGQNVPAFVPSVGTFPGVGNNVVLNSRDFTAVINALNTVGGSRIVSNPTIVAVNGSKSEIIIGRDLQTITVTQQVTAAGTPGQTTFAAGEKIFEGVKVEITPQITSNKLVSLQLRTEKSEATGFEVGPAGSGSQTFYNVRKRSGNLNMILKDGQTAAIGGLMDRSEKNTVSKVPVLGDIPGLGILFRNKTKSVDDTNLIIFITANILEPSKTTYRDLATRNQIQKLNLTNRDIEGVNYAPSAEEEAMYDSLKALRAKRQDAKIKQEMDLILNPPQPNNSKR